MRRRTTKLEESTQYTILPDSQDLFITLTKIASQLNQAGEGTSAANVSSLPPLSQRLSQIRRQKNRTCDEMFSEFMQSSGTDRAQQNVWRDTVAQYRKEANEYEDRRDDQDERWQQEDERRQDATLELLQNQTDMLWHLMEVQERQQNHRLLLQPLFNHLPSSPSSIASSPRHPRTRRGWRGLRAPNHSTQWTAQATEGCHSTSFEVAFFFPPTLLPHPARATL
nr:uncharacterized protein LOC125639521 [Caretta caretta]